MLSTPAHFHLIQLRGATTKLVFAHIFRIRDEVVAGGAIPDRAILAEHLSQCLECVRRRKKLVDCVVTLQLVVEQKLVRRLLVT